MVERPGSGGNHQIVRLRNIQLQMSVGVADWERAPGKKQPVSIDVELTAPYPQQKPAQLGDCIDYQKVMDFAAERFGGAPHIDLIEQIAWEVVEFCLAFEAVTAVRVRVAKPEVFDGAAIPEVEFYKTKP